MNSLKTNFAVILCSLFSFEVMAQEDFKVKVNTDNEPVCEGKFKPTWKSLSQYETPAWFQNAKFGIWAHWGPQSEPMMGDWYARRMYKPGDEHYRHHIEAYGHPSVHGFKDIIHVWKAENWDPDKLVALYKKAGARYFVAMANHHDNFDLWNSTYQPWNSVNMGPKKDLIAGWSAACKKYGLPFGVSVHCARAWTWYEYAQNSDSTGLFAGVPYDGNLTKSDGKGKWWEGYDPQDLYAQNHPLSMKPTGKPMDPDGRFTWLDGAYPLSQDYCDKFYNRTSELINKYSPELLYFDETSLPLYPYSDAGLQIAANMYNRSIERNNGKNEAVITSKSLTEFEQDCITNDVERGVPDHIIAQPWQTCTCIAGWHYDKWRYYKNTYKPSRQVIQILVDVVSKNGCLLLSVPIRGDGTIDATEERIVNEIGEWMAINGESIYDTRPWKVFGEGPSAEKSNPLKGVGFNEIKDGDNTANDIRFTQKKNMLYITLFGVPSESVKVVSCGKAAKLLDGKIRKVEMLGSSEKITWKQTDEALTLSVPKTMPSEKAVVYKVSI